MINTLIAAVSLDGFISGYNGMPWSLRDDLQNFMKVTMGHHLIVGRVTAEGLPPLPGREIIVVTRQENYKTNDLVARSVKAALELAKKRGDDEAFIGGGYGVFLEGLDYADKIYLTRVHTRIGEGIPFPNNNLRGWELDGDSILVRKNERNDYDFEFQNYLRIRGERS